ncbi:hypothetical protein LSCM4_02886 [Leishmania orientalis]|uniref:Uncharacterized protein n=1 Tax=Leishmania orientalis TaxID=2249476 RepID=A0A836GM13_9TRYP|nr:hypothetical protein LSCM4_02886 [Leishmania orientalis]
MPKSACAPEHTHSLRPARPRHGGTFFQASRPPLAPAGFGASAHGQGWPLQERRAHGSTRTKNIVSPVAIAAGSSVADFAKPTALSGQMSTSSLSSASSAPPAYTGATLLAGYTKRRKIVQKAAALSTSMRLQVQDVVQLEEEQRVLSQAYRGRQNLSNPQQQGLQQTQAERRSALASGDARASGEGAASSTALERDGGSTGTPESGAESVPPARAAAASLDDTKNAMLSADDGTGILLDSAFDVKQHLQQQTQEKNDMLAKMRGMQQAILELSEEAAAGVERHLVKRCNDTSAAETDGLRDGPAPDDSGGSTTEDDAGQHPPFSAELQSKLEAIWVLRSTLKEMLDAHHTPLVSVYSMSGSSVTGHAASTALSGATWLQQDAAYRPPAPLQVFSTSAFAVTLEYLSNSLACVARLADEVCVATTFRSRADPVMLLPHLDSLQKWITQAERCLVAAQRHLRHFLLGEAAVFECSAYEVDCLREQALLLKESITAQEQKLKATEDAKVSALHRIREISRRCYLWEAYLLHREDTVLSDAASRVWCPGEGIGGGAVAVPKEAEMSAAGPRVTDGSLSVSVSFRAVTSLAAEMPFPATRFEDAPSEATIASAPPPASKLRSFFRGGAQSLRGNDDAASRPLSSSAQRTPSQPSLSVYERGHQSATVSTPDLIEQRIARSWCNPYVRKQHRLQRAEQVLAQQQQRHRQQVQQQQSLERAGGSVSADLENGGDALMAEVARAPTTHPTSFNSLNSVRCYPSASETAGVAPRADSASSQVSLARLGAQADSGNSNSAAEANRSISRAADSMKAAVSGSAAASTELVTDLADVRALQLLQSLLRSNPLTNCAFAYNHAKDTGRQDTDGGGSDTTTNPSLAQSLCTDVTQDDEKRAETWQSIQRLSRYLRSCTAGGLSHRRSTSKKK